MDMGYRVKTGMKRCGKCGQNSNEYMVLRIEPTLLQKTDYEHFIRKRIGRTALGREDN
jgi:hypothetical protein